MELARSIDIDASPQAVWDVISDIEHSASTIGGIDRIDLLEPANGPSIVGLKWRETRSWRGREATEVIWITEAREPSHYAARAESGGALYTSRFQVEPAPDGSRLTMSFHARPLTTAARVLWALTGWMAKRALARTIDQDLADVKAAVEGGV